MDSIPDVEKIAALMLRLRHLGAMREASLPNPPYWWCRETAALEWVLAIIESSPTGEYKTAAEIADRVYSRRMNPPRARHG
jgi:hypothetical protein